MRTTGWITYHGGGREEEERKYNFEDANNFGSCGSARNSQDSACQQSEKNTHRCGSGFCPIHPIRLDYSTDVTARRILAEYIHS